MSFADKKSVFNSRLVYNCVVEFFKKINIYKRNGAFLWQGQKNKGLSFYILKSF